jgi:hypothetical protein
MRSALSPRHQARFWPWVGALLLVAVAAPFASARTSVKDPNAIACPAAPAGWDSSPVRKDVATPQSVPEPDAEEHFATGGNQVTVSCTYFASLVEQVTLRVSYALPTDINPVSDFYWGCGTGGLPWNDSERVYRVVSVQQWANASLIDLLGAVPQANVPTFEAVTRKLLQNAEGFGHPCTIVSKPTALTSRYSFDIHVAGGNLKSVFWTSESEAKGGVQPVVQADVSTSVLNVNADGKPRALAIKLTHGIDYHPTRFHTADTVRYAVQVVSTKVPGCKRGATGILTISNRPSLLLRVCGQSFLRSETPRRIRFFG